MTELNRDVLVLCKVARFRYLDLWSMIIWHRIFDISYSIISTMRPAQKKKKEKMSEEIQPSRWRDKLQGRLAKKLQRKANSNVQQWNRNMGAEWCKYEYVVMWTKRESERYIECVKINEYKISILFILYTYIIYIYTL